MKDGDIVLVDKPKGITSFDVIRKLWRMYGKMKMGHAGTLDPNATGLMILAVGSATKRLPEFLKLPKCYEAEIQFGMQTDSGDCTGKIIQTKEASHISEQLIAQALNGMKGVLELAVPMYSAIKKDGKALYAYARAGETVVVPVKQMTIRDARCESYNSKTYRAKIFFDVESGTYIRTLAEELAKRMNTVATLTELRRLSIGMFTLENALRLE